MKPTIQSQIIFASVLLVLPLLSILYVYAKPGRDGIAEGVGLIGSLMMGVLCWPLAAYFFHDLSTSSKNLIYRIGFWLSLTFVAATFIFFFMLDH